MYKNRKSLYEELEKQLSTKLLVYITSDRAGCETQIAQDVIDLFINHLEKIGPVPKISLYLYTRGGDIADAWNIINLLRMYCEELQVIIPHKAHSAGTLISIGANSIIMTKQATLGPIDPSLNTPMNPPIPGAVSQTFPVSVEDVNGYLEFAQKELGIKDDMSLSNIVIKLSERVHPLVLGKVYRTRAQIKMLAEKLLTNQVNDGGKIKQIISFLCSDSGSHDYTINRREAKNQLGLNIIKPSMEIYKTINCIYCDIKEELCLSKRFNLKDIANINNGDYNICRGLIESILGGSDSFVSKGKIRMCNNIPGGIQNECLFEGWQHEDTKD